MSIVTKSFRRLSAILGIIFVAGFFLSSFSITPVQAFKHDFLYKFGSFWSDVTTDGAFLYLTNSAYSQINKYTTGGVYTATYGGYGSATGKLNQPMGITLVGSNLYVADTGNNRIQKLDTSGGYVASWGVYGTAGAAGASPQLNAPQDVAVNAAVTYLFVADTGNNRIQAINLSTGNVASMGGSLGRAPTQFSAPKGLAVMDSGTPNILWVFVADTGNNRLVQYSYDTSTNNFAYIGIIGGYGTGNNQFNQPNKIVIDGSNLIYVTDTTNRIQKFDNGRNFLASWNVHDSKGTTGLTTYTTTLYVVEPYHQVDLYNAQSTAFSTSFTNEPNQPSDISTDMNDNVYLDNASTNTIQKFNSSWVPVAEWGGNGSNFSGSMGFGVNTGGEVLVGDTGNNRVQRFDTNGTYVNTLPTPLVTPVGFAGPKDVAMENTGKMYVADTNNNRILKFNFDANSQNFNIIPDWSIGNPTPTWAATPGVGTPTPTPPLGPYFNKPYGITVDTQNKIYVADSGYSRIQKFNANGTFEKSWGLYGSADNLPDPMFDNPEGMAIETTGVLTSYFIYVADTGNNRIQRFNQDGTKDPTADVWGTYGTNDGQFEQPRGITLDSSKRVYVSEAAGKRVQVFGDATLNAGLTVVETGGTAVSEDGSVIDSYTIKLKTQPSANVTVNITSTDLTQLTVSSPTLTFTPYNWNIPQVVTVLPVHDFIAEASASALVLTNTASSTDTHYQGVSSPVTVTLTNMDTVGINFSKTSVNVTEAGATNTFTIVLNSKPTANVAITMNSVDGQLTGNTTNPTTLTFTPSNWNTPQSIIVGAVHDFIANGSRDSYPTFSTTTTDTSGYQTAAFPSFVAHITDVDVAGVVISGPTLSLTEGGAAGTFTVYLNSKPTANVTLTPTFSATQASVLPGVLTFTPANYNTAQTVTVTALHDNIVNATQPRNVDITYASASLDPNYAPGVTFTGGTSPGNIMRIIVTDIDVAGFAFSKGQTYLTEGLTTDTFTIALMSKPSGTVIITSAYPAGFEATTSAYIHTFTPTNWNTPQTATISAVNNNIYEGTHSATLIHSIAISADPNYGVGPLAQGILTTVYDTDWPGMIITLPNGALNVTEGGATDQFSVKLKTQPLNNVTIIMNGGTDLTTTPSSLTFTTTNWGAYQISTVSAANNFIVQGPHTGTLNFLATSSDAGYNGLQANQTVNIADSDNTVPGVQIVQGPNGTQVTKQQPPTTYTMVLTSRPTANVRIKVISDTNQYATTSGAIFNFAPSVWNIPQTVTVYAKDTPDISPDRTVTFSHIVTSNDPHYNGIAVDNVIITVHDKPHPVSSTSAPTCSATPPSNQPNLFQINTTQNSATLYFTPIRDNISYYFVTYGLSSGDIRYGVSFDQGSYDGVLNYTIFALQPSTRYYFKIRGGNGCAPGPWSNESSGVTAASGSASTYIYYTPASSYASSGSSGGTASSGSSNASHPQFARNLYPGSTGNDVRSLQMYLNGQGFILAQSGPGSPGNETILYGPLTAAAVRRFQEAHYQEILSPLGYSSGTGIFGPSTRAYVNSH